MAESIEPKKQAPILTKGSILWSEFLSPWCGKGFSPPGVARDSLPLVWQGILSPWCGRGFSPLGVARDFSPHCVARDFSPHCVARDFSPLGVARDSLPLVGQEIYLTLVWQDFSLAKVSFQRRLRVFTQPLCAIACVNVCACVNNPKHWQPNGQRTVWTHANTVHPGRNG